MSSNLVYKPSVGKANTLSCGCLLKEMRHEARFKDITGQRFGRLVALHVYTGEDNRKNKTTRWVCQCDCGNTAIVGTANLINGHSRSCGCLIEERRTTHGIGKTSVGKHLSGIHTAMQARCYNPTANGYANYGGRGIYICDEWYQPGVEGNPGLVNFYNWSIENGYEIGLTIDRIDNDGPYAPWNCRWVTYIDQMNNTSANKHIIDIDGERLTFAQFDRKHGLPSNYTSHYARYHTLNEIVYMVHHPELKLRQKKGKFIDQYGFTHLVPNYQNRNRRTIPHGKQKDRRA